MTSLTFLYDSKLCNKLRFQMMIFEKMNFSIIPTFRQWQYDYDKIIIFCFKNTIYSSNFKVSQNNLEHY